MKILIIAFPNSIHTARWISQISDQNWEIHLISSTDVNLIHPEIKNTIIHTTFHGSKKGLDSTIKIKGIPTFNNYIASQLNGLLKKYIPRYKEIQLLRLIKKINPDIIHSLEIQSGGYLTLKTKKILKNKFPKWIATNWGSDIYLFGRFKDHKKKIEEVLKNCDFYSCECNRDVNLAKKFNFTGNILPVLPNSGGLNIKKIESIKSNQLTSTRKFIMLKGYQGWAGRALVGLQALKRCSNLLKDYELIIYSIDKAKSAHGRTDVEIEAELLSQDCGIKVTTIPTETPHEEILALHSKARISIGVSISDGISTSLLEAMAMGSFPIQSWTSCANEWIIDGKNGILIPPDDPEIIKDAIIKALTDDNLVNTAAKENWETIRLRLDKRKIKSTIIKYYQEINNKTK